MKSMTCSMQQNAELLGSNLTSLTQVLSATPGAQQTQQRFPTHFSEYPRKPSYFDVYSPTIKTLQHGEN